MDKKRGLIIGGFLLAVLLVSLVAAQSELGLGESTKKVVDEFVDFIKPVASSVLGKTPSGSEYLFAKVLFLIIVLAIIWTALNRVEFFNEKPWILFVVSLAVSILATRWLTTEDIINTIILPYSTLGIAITAGFPFVLWFLIINVGLQGEGRRTVRRIAWIFFAVIFIGLYITRQATMEGARWIYPVTALAAFIMAIMDGTIQGFFNKLQMEKASAGRKGHALRAIQLEQERITEIYSGNPTGYVGTIPGGGQGKPNGAQAYHADMAALDKQIRTLLRRR